MRKQIFVYQSALVLISIGGVLGTANAQSPAQQATSNAPWAPYVPEGYVPAPGGYFVHSSCIHTVPSGAVVDIDGNASVNGMSLPHNDPCPYPRIKNGSTGHPPGMHNYMYTQQPAGPPAWTAVSTNQYVPPNPVNNDGQLVYYWNGLQDTGNLFVLQPVLQWGGDNGFGGEFWQIASWLVWSDGNYTRTNAVQVTAGDYLDYDIEVVSVSGDTVTFDIRATDVTTNQVRTLSVQESGSEVTGKMFVIPAALEFYTAPNCGTDVPEALFTNIHLWNGTLNPLQYNPATNNPINEYQVSEDGSSCFYNICSGYDNCESASQVSIIW